MRDGSAESLPLCGAHSQALPVSRRCPGGRAQQQSPSLTATGWRTQQRGGLGRRQSMPDEHFASPNSRALPLWTPMMSAAWRRVTLSGGAAPSASRAARTPQSDAGAPRITRYRGAGRRGIQAGPGQTGGINPRHGSCRRRLIAGPPVGDDAVGGRKRRTGQRGRRRGSVATTTAFARTLASRPDTRQLVPSRSMRCHRVIQAYQPAQRRGHQSRK